MPSEEHRRSSASRARKPLLAVNTAAAAASVVPKKRREPSAAKTAAAASAVPKKRREPSAAKTAAAASAVPKKRRRNDFAEEAEDGAAAGATPGDADKDSSADEVDRAVALGDALFAGCDEPKSGSDEDAELSFGENASENDDGGEEKELSRRDLLKGIDVSDSSDGEDSSDDERAQESRTGGAHNGARKTDKLDVFAQGHQVIALDSSKKKLQAVEPVSNAKRGVVYLGRIPPGFYEEQMRDYFSQFGEVTRLRLARNKKTGRSKQYAFLEFRSEDVANIICDTMHNYLLSGRLLQCKLIPAASVHPKTFVGAGRRYRVTDHYAAARKQHNAEKTQKGIRAAFEKERAAAKKKTERLRRSGIDYQFDG
ncbi:MAG: hypothetical protein BJ554DRAFT_6454 [Olpidium bornovanus]|uniref:RRM domain-containing protein n=1 Tax=Olpidium bornovanus TaxID=278681 RepID=A0A8H8A298_9FUNG|nr:MAG: hypothetical protein BJ554DRAFT_6454 [Olpidium bornovanus]